MSCTQNSIQVALLAISGALLMVGCTTRFQLTEAQVMEVPRNTLPAELKEGSWPQDSSLLRVELVVRPNLRFAAQRFELNIGNKVFACDDRAREYSAMPYIFDAIGLVDAYDRADMGGDKVWFFLAQRSDTRRSNNQEVIPAYDLHERPTDICVEFTGGSMIGRRVQTNTLRFSPSPGN